MEHYLADEGKYMVNTMFKAGRDEYGFTKDNFRHKSLTGESLSYMLWAVNGGARAAYHVGNIERREGHADVVRHRVRQFANAIGKNETTWPKWVEARFKSHLNDIISEKLRNFG